MSFFERFGIVFGGKKKTALPPVSINANTVENRDFGPTDINAYKTLAMFDLNIESPKFEGAVPDATVKFYPLK